MITPILKYHIRMYVSILLLSIAHTAFGNFLSQNSRHDPYPMHTTRDPHHFLYVHERLDLKGYNSELTTIEKIGLGLSVWGQNADSAKDIHKKTISPGNLDGKWSMIGLLLGDTPSGKTLPASLQAAAYILQKLLLSMTPIK